MRVIGRWLAVAALCLTLGAGIAILSELRQIRQLLERQQGAQAAKPNVNQPLSVSIVGAYAIGRDDAPVTMVEFTDYECPFCQEFHRTTFEKLKAAYVDTGQVRFVSRDMPVQIHPHAFMAAEAARCAGDQGKYWQARHALMTAPGQLTTEAIMKAVRAAGADEALVKKCLDGMKYRPAVQKDLADVQAAAILGTPTFVLGRSTADRIGGELIVGAQPYEVFEARIRELLGTKP